MMRILYWLISVCEHFVGKISYGKGWIKIYACMYVCVCHFNDMKIKKNKEKVSPDMWKEMKDVITSFFSGMLVWVV